MALQQHNRTDLQELPTEFTFLAERKKVLLAELQAIEELEKNIIKGRELLLRVNNHIGNLDMTADEYEKTNSGEYVRHFLNNTLEFTPEERQQLSQKKSEAI